MTELFSFQGAQVGRFALRQVPLGKLSLHLVADENGQIITKNQNFFKKIVIFIILL